MPFKFLTYLQPTHYFRLFKKDKSSVFPKIQALPESVVNQLKRDGGYSSKSAQDYDLSWRLVQKGYIGQAACYKEFKKLPLKDEYRFIRKNFHQAWVLYVLLIRLVSFKNPFKELAAFFRTKEVQRVDEHQNPFQYTDYNDFKSKLIQQQPLVSVVIPTLNRYRYLKDVLKDLEQQEYTNFEVIVVDQSEPFQKEFYDECQLNLHLIHQEEKALWLARNKAIQQSQGNYILLFDDDSRVDTNWISQHLKTLDYFRADLSSGVSISTQGAKVPANYAHFGVSSQLDTGYVLLKKEIFRQLGLFDRQFEKQRMGDGEFGMRVYLAGIKSVSNPFASCVDVKAGTGGLREMGSWDAFRPTKLFSPRPIPSVIYFFRRYFGKRATKMALLRMVPLSILPYQFKKNKPLLIIGVLLSFLLLPLICYQVVKSWRLANVKLREGPRIEELE